MSDRLCSHVRLDVLDESGVALAEMLGQGFSRETENTTFALEASASGLALRALGSGENPIRVDFVAGKMAYRRLHGGGAGQAVARAIGVRGSVCPSVLDLTAGLGGDAFVLAALGCEVTLVERHPVIAALLADGLRRAQLDPEVSSIVARMQLIVGDARAVLQTWQGVVPQVVYLDPMFPEREKTAQVKKEMRTFQQLVGADEDAEGLFAPAYALASHRVVVKRPRLAPCLVTSPPPAHRAEGRSSRFDVYGKRAFQ